MPTDPDDALSTAHRLRHELRSSLTIICTRTQLLQRQLARMDGFADGDRARLVKGLAAILTAARAVNSTANQLPGMREDREA